MWNDLAKVSNLLSIDILVGKNCIILTFCQSEYYHFTLLTVKSNTKIKLSPKCLTPYSAGFGEQNMICEHV